ncbi:MAG: hypothetical protein M4579_002730 [Chaenotheca gracillima]|nr:MAG: hypothetical protein M4579_002730 [Chaenotheca gracillima]
MATHQAYVKPSPDDLLERQSLETRQPSTGQVLIDVLAAPVGAAANVLLSGKIYPLAYPLTPGGSAVARVAAVGPDAVKLKKGQLVYCSTYVQARDDHTGATSILQGGFAMPTPDSIKLMEGPWRHGTWAQKALVPTENITVLDESRLFGHFGYTAAQLCWITSFLITSEGWDVIGLTAGETVIVAPASGHLGSLTIRTALALGAGTVIAAARNSEKLQKVAKFADDPRVRTVTLTGDAAADTQALRAATPRGEGADVYMDFSPPQAVDVNYPSACVDALKRGGRVILEGGVNGKLTLNYLTLIVNNITIKGNLMFKTDAPSKLIRLIESGQLDLNKLETKTVKFEDDPEEALKAAEKSTDIGVATTLVFQ